MAHTLAMLEVGGNGNLLLVLQCMCLYFRGESRGCFYEVTDVILWRTEKENTLSFVILCSFPEGIIR